MRDVCLRVRYSMFSMYLPVFDDVLDIVRSPYEANEWQPSLWLAVAMLS